MLREEGISDFVYDEDKDLFRCPDGRFAFSREWADVKPAKGRLHLIPVYTDLSVHKTHAYADVWTRVSEKKLCRKPGPRERPERATLAPL